MGETDNFYKNATNWVLSLNIDDSLRISLLALVSQMDENGFCEVSKAEWAAIRKLSRRSLFRHQAKLEEAGYITVSKMTGSKNTFYIDVKKVVKDWFNEHIHSYGKKSNRPNLPMQWKWDVLEKSNYECVYCGAKKYLEIDHIIPLAKGGTHSLKNLQALCAACNSKKSDSIAEVS